jgi:putative ABC transport system permease protein
MTLGRIIFNNARQRRLSTILTSLSIGVGVALIIAILTIKNVSEERFSLSYSGFDMVVGAKGSPLQLVLNVVYNLDTSPGNISYSIYQKLQKDPRVKMVVPFSVGDSYRGFRLVGTTDTYLKNFQPTESEPFRLASGRVFEFNEAELLEAMKEAEQRAKDLTSPTAKKAHHEEHKEAEHFEAVIGAAVARETNLKVGDKIVATHGIEETSEHKEHEEAPWTVVGVLSPTGTPSDRTIYINLDSFYHIEGHVIEEKAGADASKEPEIGQVSALGLQLRSPIHVFGLQKEINDSTAAQAARPVAEMQKLFTIVGNVNRILLIQAILIVLVSAIGTGLAMFNSMNDRRRDIAVMRALGAKRRTIVAIIVGEAVLISAIGAILGLVLGHATIHLAAPILEAAVGFSIPGWIFHPFEAVILLGVLLVGAGAGIGPAISAYRTDVATGLSPNS